MSDIVHDCRGGAVGKRWRRLFASRVCAFAVSAAAVGCLLSTTKVQAAEAVSIGVFKVALFSQDETDSAAKARGYAAAAVVSVPYNADTARLLGHAGTEALGLVDGVYVGGAVFPAKEYLDSRYPDGSYAVAIGATPGGDAAFPLVVNGSFATAPKVTNIAAAQSIVGGVPFTVTWEPFVAATSRDIISLEVRSIDGTFVYQSPAIGRPGAIMGTATSYTLTLPPSRQYIGTLSFGRLSYGDPGETHVRVFGGTIAETEFPLRTLEGALVPTILTQPASRHVAAGGAVQLEVVASVPGGGLQYQWKRDGMVLAGETGAQLSISAASASDMGIYSVEVSGPLLATVESSVATLTVAGGGSSRLANLSSRAWVPAGGELISGFVIRGSGLKSILVRGVGRQLSAFGVPSPMPNPRFDLMAAGSETAVLSNDDWGGGQALALAFAEVGAFPLNDASSAAASGAVPVNEAQAYTVRVVDAAGQAGAALAEIYDCDPQDSPRRIVNLSTRTFVSPGNTLIAGFAVTGVEPRRVMIRGVGPGLAAYGVAAPLADPRITVYPLGRSYPVAANDNWARAADVQDAQGSAGAFKLAPGSRDAALVVWLPPGAYTVELASVGDTAGVGMVEIYDLSP